MKFWDIIADTRRKLLTDVVRAAGFELEKILEFNRVGVIAWWLNGRLLRRRIFGLWQIKLLNLMTPIFRLIDSPAAAAAFADSGDQETCGRGNTDGIVIAAFATRNGRSPIA